MTLKMIKSIHDFSVTDIYGKNFDFNNMKGKKIMVVNTASSIGLTPQYKALEKLYKEYKDKKALLLLVSQNNFLWQNQELMIKLLNSVKKIMVYFSYDE